VGVLLQTLKLSTNQISESSDSPAPNTVRPHFQNPDSYDSPMDRDSSDCSPEHKSYCKREETSTVISGDVHHEESQGSSHEILTIKQYCLMERDSSDYSPEHKPYCKDTSINGYILGEELAGSTLGPMTTYYPMDSSDYSPEHKPYCKDTSINGYILGEELAGSTLGPMTTYYPMDSSDYSPEHKPCYEGEDASTGASGDTLKEEPQRSSNGGESVTIRYTRLDKRQHSSDNGDDPPEEKPTITIKRR
jgi:hypothetical protein